jgi:hypothetical protein
MPVWAVLGREAWISWLLLQVRILKARSIRFGGWWVAAPVRYLPGLGTWAAFALFLLALISL